VRKLKAGMRPPTVKGTEDCLKTTKSAFEGGSLPRIVRRQPTACFGVFTKVRQEATDGVYLCFTKVRQKATDGG